jgi:hypothetical protein
MPFAFNLMDSGKVSQRSNVQVFLECRIPGDGFLGVDGGAFGVTKLEVDVFGLSILEAELSLGRVEGLASSADRIGAMARNPCLLDDHGALGKGTGLVKADV